MQRAWDGAAFGRLIDEIRTRTGLSQAAMARLADMDPTRITRWRSGDVRPDYDSVVRLATGITTAFPATVDVVPGLFAAAGYPPGGPPDTRPDFVREHWANPDVRGIWGLETMPPETRAGLIAHYLRGAPDLSGNGGGENGAEGEQA
jgi:transcriptional regulator with XRE-family HTH domain